MPLEVLRRKVDRLDLVPEQFVTSTELANRQILARLIELMDQLLLDSSGAIRLTTGNLATITLIVEEMSEVVFLTDYGEALVEFTEELGKQKILNNEYFKIIEKSFDEKQMYDSVFNASRRKAVGSFDSAAINRVFVSPMAEILENSVTTRKSMADAIKGLTDFVLGTDEIDGALTRHVKQVAFDAFAFADRDYSQVVREDLGLVWLRYAGSLIKDSREFCITRAGKYWHVNEVAAWGSIKQWQGRIPSTDSSTIFTFLGGYNCRHSLVSVTESEVPREVIERNKSLGNI